MNNFILEAKRKIFAYIPFSDSENEETKKAQDYIKTNIELILTNVFLFGKLEGKDEAYKNMQEEFELK